MLTFASIFRYLFFPNNLGSLAASGKVDINVCKHIIEKTRNVSFVYKFYIYSFYFITTIARNDITS